MKSKIFLFLGIAAILASSCKEKDLYDESLANQKEAEKEVANDFNFTTFKTVKMNVDYSAYNTYGPVFFSIYSENPFKGEEESLTMKENVKPLYENYTDEKGKFSMSVVLPSYMKTFYVVTGNFFVQQPVIEAYLVGDEVTAIATNLSAKAGARRMKAFFKADAASGKVGDIDSLYQLWNKVNVNTGADLGEGIYKKWHTPLGTWDAETGRPNYLLTNASDPRLLFTEEEKEGLYQTVANALQTSQTCSEVYRKQGDLTISAEQGSEVSITFLGGFTCWNNTLGYYYYTGEKPTSLKDLNIIMIFPNTQDGYWVRNWWPNPDFYGNIALDRGDAVQLMYYPNIAQDSYEGASPVFPKGTKIGFILKPSGWGMQRVIKNENGEKMFYNNYKGDGPLRRANLKIGRQYNVWATSTDGLSYCSTEQMAGDAGVFSYPNPNGDSRTAKFEYKSDNGDEYAIVSFEDACNDLDYDDVIFALKPVNAFEQLPVVEDKKTSTTSVYAFEDMWPQQGDYDLNDAIVELKQEKVFSKKSNESKYKITKQTFSLTTYLNYVTKTSGLAVKLEGNNLKNAKTIAIKKVAKNSADTVDVKYTKDGNVYLLTPDIKGEENTTYIIEVEYKSGITDDANTATVKPFIYRDEADGMRWEVHIPFEAPTDKMNTSYFGTQDDRSVPEEGKYYVRAGEYPFAFCLTGVTIDSFKETLLLRDNERIRISDLYPTFLDWATSKGESNADWYLHPFSK